MPKKLKPIKAEKYDDQEEFEDDYYEDENEQEEVVEDFPNTFKVIEDESEDEKDYDEFNKTFRRINSTKFIRAFNVIFIILMIVMLIIGIDVICIARYNIGPFFAVKTKTYEDGGTKEYYGLGYKVIKYNELNGRQDTQIGFWSMKYSIDPVAIEDIDLAIEFQNKPEETANKYYKQYIIISSTIKEIDSDDNEITLEYSDPDGKYTLEIECEMASKKKELANYKVNDKISIKGTVYRFSVREGNSPNSVSLLNCFVE